MSNLRYLLDPKRLGLATTSDPNSLDLATISSPSVMGLERLQTQAAWVWRGCQTLIIPKFWPPQWLKNQGWCFFLETHFQPKTPRNHPNNLFKPTFNLQKRKKTSQKSKINSETNFFSISNLVFRHFQGKKIPKLNFSCHMEPFEKKI